MERAASAAIAIVIADEMAFPEQLKEHTGPAGLHYYRRGSLLPQDKNAAALVRTRIPTNYRFTVTQQMALRPSVAGHHGRKRHGEGHRHPGPQRGTRRKRQDQRSARLL